MADLTGLTALITGAAGGIGTALAETFAAAGARFALVDVKDPVELAQTLGPMHRGYVLDLEAPRQSAPLSTGSARSSGSTHW